jgi:hypothetical protein
LEGRVSRKCAGEFERESDGMKPSATARVRGCSPRAWTVHRKHTRHVITANLNYLKQ